MVVYIDEKNMGEVFIVEGYFFVWIYGGGIGCS